jgi:hypothetical protein
MGDSTPGREVVPFTLHPSLFTLLKSALGALLFDVPRWELRLRGFGAAESPWVFVRNREDVVQTSAALRGLVCTWEYGRDLYLPKVFPSYGERLMAAALRDWPVELADASPPRHDTPDVSFVIGHRGRARLPHLLATLRSIAAQRDVAFECVVVEQASAREIEDGLPEWVRYVHTPLPRPDLPYCRSWAFNVGARAARGRLLVLHDNDFLIPRSYAAELWSRHRLGAELLDLKRFGFYLSAEQTAAIFAGATPAPVRPLTIVENLQGGSLAASREAYFAIGGFDESFIGWGGEDNDFWDRAATRTIDPFGYLPLIHLWHESQPEKLQGEEAPAVQRYRRLREIDPHERIARLLARDMGRLDGPVTE